MLLKNCNIVRVQICVEKNIFFVRTNRKLKVCLKNRKNPDKIRAFLWLYLFCSLLMAEEKGFEPLHPVTGLRDFESRLFDHLSTPPYLQRGYYSRRTGENQAIFAGRGF